MNDLSERKLRHLDACLNYPVQFQTLRTGLADVPWPYRALPEVDLDAVKLETTFLGRQLSAPLLIGAMTGGAERAAQINRTLAQAAQQTGIGLMLGSQRVMLEHPGVRPSFRVREVAPDILLIGNLGVGQLLKGYGAAEIDRAAELVSADAMALHLNPLQEALQVAGDTAYRGMLERLHEVLPACRTPVMLKEVGHGLGASVARQVAGLPIAALDVAGAGGTSWARVEAFVRDGQVLAPDLCDLGIPTAQALRECRQLLPELPLMASGGIRTGLDIAKSLKLGAQVCAIAQPFLPLALEGVDAVVEHIERLKQELRVALFVGGFDGCEVVRRSGEG